MVMKNKDEIKKIIKQKYDTNLAFLTPRSQNHFSLRSYRMSGEKRYEQPIFIFQLIMRDWLMPPDKIFFGKNYIREKSSFLFRELPDHNFKTKKRKNIFRSKKKLLFDLNILEVIYNWKLLGLDRNKNFHIFFQRGIDYLSLIDFDKILLSFDEFLEYYPADAISKIYYLDYLGILDRKKEIENKFKNIFLNIPIAEDFISDYKRAPSFFLRNKLYGMTHFIINKSLFYQNFVYKNDFDWILDYFKNNIKEIIRLGTPDILAEVGLCFKLCKQDATREIEEYLLDSFDKKMGYIVRGKGGINCSEHTNILAILFFSDFKKLYKGPDLSSYSLSCF